MSFSLCGVQISVVKIERSQVILRVGIGLVILDKMAIEALDEILTRLLRGSSNLFVRFYFDDLPSTLQSLKLIGLQIESLESTHYSTVAEPSK